MRRIINPWKDKGFIELVGEVSLYRTKCGRGECVSSSNGIDYLYLVDGRLVAVKRYQKDFKELTDIFTKEIAERTEILPFAKNRLQAYNKGEKK